MTFSVPVLLVVGMLVAALLVVAAVRLGRRRLAALQAAGVTRGRTRAVPLGVWLRLGALVVLAVAVAGPAARLPVGRSAGTVVLAMDSSNSMSATDVKPTRLAAAQTAAAALVDAQPDTVDIGVVGFDQGALTTSRPTADRVAAKASVANLRTSGGTSLAAAILGSLTAITGKPVAVGKDGQLPDIGYWPSATIVVFSDGEMTAGGADAVAAAATIAQNAGIHIDTVGVGTADGTTVKIDGYQLHTALDTKQLTSIAESTGGHYHPASDANQLNGVASSIDLRLTVSQQDVPLAGAFVAAALALLLAGALLTGIRTGQLV